LRRREKTENVRTLPVLSHSYYCVTFSFRMLRLFILCLWCNPIEQKLTTELAETLRVWYHGAKLERSWLTTLVIDPIIDPSILIVDSWIRTTQAEQVMITSKWHQKIRNDWKMTFNDHFGVILTSFWYNNLLFLGNYLVSKLRSEIHRKKVLQLFCHWSYYKTYGN